MLTGSPHPSAKAYKSYKLSFNPHDRKPRSDKTAPEQPLNDLGDETNHQAYDSTFTRNSLPANSTMPTITTYISGGESSSEPTRFSHSPKLPAPTFHGRVWGWRASNRPRTHDVEQQLQADQCHRISVEENMQVSWSSVGTR